MKKLIPAEHCTFGKLFLEKIGGLKEEVIMKSFVVHDKID